jgi:large subunit ribosomal protein L13
MTQTLTRITKTPKLAERNSAWFILDAKGVVLGRLASRSAELILGKGKPSFTPGVSLGDHVIIINAKEVAVTGRKESKSYFRHSGYPGGLKEVTLGRLRQTHPDRIIYEAVKGMLPKTRLGALMIKKLHIYADSEHEFGDKKPVEVKVG